MHSSSRFKQFFRTFRREITFVVLFVIFFTAGLALHFSLRNYSRHLLVDTLNAKASAFIINTIKPAEKVVARQSVIGSGAFSIRIAEGCEGIEGVLLVVAAILAFPMTWKLKILGAVLGSLVVYLANLARITALYFTVKYRPGLFNLMHLQIGQTFIIVIGILFFVSWIYVTEKPGKKSG
ncbi:MAG: archaeosortase/exosortase family protein [Deltaproteobacteria bacterium]|nr:archaeosortase/exosortase family protein [Deltaproteobacteria bacterium]